MKKVFMVEVEKTDKYNNSSYNYCIVVADSKLCATNSVANMYPSTYYEYDFDAYELEDVKYDGDHEDCFIVGMW